MNWPKFSVIVPSYNQATFIEETLRSVIDQNYPNLELIVIDGGSTDGSVDIIKKYETHITYWVSEPDGGQTPGLIKGFNKSTGDIQCWLNSDDLLQPGSLKEVAEFFVSHPDIDVVYGDALWIDSESKTLSIQREIPFNRFLWMHTYNYVTSMSTFWRKQVYDKVGGLDPSYNLAMDADLVIRFADVVKLSHVSRVWSCMRYYAEQKNRRFRDASDKEDLRIRVRYWGTEKPFLLGAKKRLAQAIRVSWKLVTGCYSLKYRHLE